MTLLSQSASCACITITLHSTITTPTHTDSLLIHHSYALPDSHPCSNSHSIVAQYFFTIGTFVFVQWW